MFKDFLKIYKYLFENHPESADEICYSINLINTYLNKSKSYLKNDMHKAIDNDNNQYYETINEYYKIIMAINKNSENLLESLDKISFNNNRTISEEKTIIIETDKKWLPINSNFGSTRVNGLIFEKQEYRTKDLTEAFIKVCELLYDIDSDKFEKMIMSDLAFGKSRKYFSKDNDDNKKYSKLKNADIYVLVNSNSNFKANLIIKMLDYYNYSHDIVKLAICQDYNPKPRNVSIRKKITDQKTNGIKIGRYVKEKMQELSNCSYRFTDEMLTALTSKELTKQLIGVNYTMLVKYEDMQKGEYNEKKYWKETFVFNGEKYYVTSQWYDYMKEGFDKWYRGLKFNPSTYQAY